MTLVENFVKAVGGRVRKFNPNHGEGGKFSSGGTFSITNHGNTNSTTYEHSGTGEKVTIHQHLFGPKAGTVEVAHENTPSGAKDAHGQVVGQGGSKSSSRTFVDQKSANLLNHLKSKGITHSFA
jgi:hypothetical protein